MAHIRSMEEHDAERVRDLWLQMCAEAGTPLPAASSQLILANLRQYATHQSVHCFVAEEQHIIIGFVTCEESSLSFFCLRKESTTCVNSKASRN
jgi:hypothetical protein